VVILAAVVVAAVAVDYYYCYCYGCGCGDCDDERDYYCDCDYCAFVALLLLLAAEEKREVKEKWAPLVVATAVATVALQTMMEQMEQKRCHKLACKY